MRPKLKIGPLTQLQDARSSAAVGFDFLSFSLERGSTRKLAPSMVWNIINWIQGPSIVLELNAESLDELVETTKMFPPQVLSFPFADWNHPLIEDVKTPIHLIASGEHTPEEIAEKIDELEKLGQSVHIEVSLGGTHEVAPYQPFLDKLFLHFTQSESLIEFLQSTPNFPYGFTLRDEFREDAEYLDYERIDELMEILEERFPQE